MRWLFNFFNKELFMIDRSKAKPSQAKPSQAKPSQAKPSQCLDGWVEKAS
jgi:hypothetical protein